LFRIKGFHQEGHDGAASAELINAKRNSKTLVEASRREGCGPHGCPDLCSKQPTRAGYTAHQGGIALLGQVW
jgi:hypothetical protein